MGDHGLPWATMGVKGIAVGNLGDRSRISFEINALNCYERTRGNRVARDTVFLLCSCGELCQTACKPGSVRPLQGGTTIHLRRASLRTWCDQPGRRDGTVPASRPHADAAGHPYSVLLPVGFALPPLLPGARCALTAPFHPCRGRDPGGLFSVALSLGSPPPAVSRHRVPVEPGLSSTPCGAAAVQPSGRRGSCAGAGAGSRRQSRRSRFTRSHAALMRATFSLARATNSAGTPRDASVSGWFSRISRSQACRASSSVAARAMPSTA